jgi:hypothetical protein
MKRFLTTLLAVGILVPTVSFAVTRSKTQSSDRFLDRGVSIDLADPTGSVYQNGEAVSFMLESDNDAYVIVFNIDTEGYVHLLVPHEGEAAARLAANRRYPIPQSPDEELLVGGKRGMEFVFAVSVRDRDAIADREIARFHESEYGPENQRIRIEGDPFTAANQIASQLIRGIRYSAGVSLAYTYFFMGEAVDYPRYMCLDCYETGADPYQASMPAYAATAVFDREDRLAYPFDMGFERAYTDNLVRPEALRDASYEGDNETTTTVEHVYVTSYPRWNHGYYGVNFYCDPWYYPWSWGYYGGYYPYAPFYFSVGWNWGWGGWGYNYCRSPYYYPYYYQGRYHHYSPRRYNPYPNRGLRPGGKRYKGTSSLYAGLNLKSQRKELYRGASVAGPGSKKLPKTPYLQTRDGYGGGGLDTKYTQNLKRRPQIQTPRDVRVIKGTRPNIQTPRPSRTFKEQRPNIQSTRPTKGQRPSIQPPRRTGTTKGTRPNIQPPRRTGTTKGTRPTRPNIQSPRSTRTTKGTRPNIQSPRSTRTTKGTRPNIQSPRSGSGKRVTTGTKAPTPRYSKPARTSTRSRASSGGARRSGGSRGGKRK